MRFNTAISMLVFSPAFTQAFHVGSTNFNPTAITSTSLEARRMLAPMLRRRRPTSSVFFPDVDRLFREMDEMIESSFDELSRPSSMLALNKYPQAQGLGLRQSLGFDVTQDEKEFKVTMNLGDVDVKDVDLQLDADGRMLRLKGNTVQEDSGMKIQSSFEKAVLLHPDVETDMISASFDHGVLSIVAPKVVKDEVVEEKQPMKIDIHVTEAKSEMNDAASETELSGVPTRLAIETMKDEKVAKEKSELAENTANGKKWPARDFPY
jgi:HSP20 family protein